MNVRRSMTRLYSRVHDVNGAATARERSPPGLAKSPVLASAHASVSPTPTLPHGRGSATHPVSQSITIWMAVTNPQSSPHLGICPAALVDRLGAVLIDRHQLHQPPDLVGARSSDFPGIPSHPHGIVAHIRLIPDFLCGNLAMRRRLPGYCRRADRPLSRRGVVVRGQFVDWFRAFGRRSANAAVFIGNRRRLELARGKQGRGRALSPEGAQCRRGDLRQWLECRWCHSRPVSFPGLR